MTFRGRAVCWDSMFVGAVAGILIQTLISAVQRWP